MDFNIFGQNIFALVIVLGILVFFHEFGHFLFARLFKVGVETFSLGFGPKIFGKKIGQTDYRISAIPLGGYVKMVGEDPGAEIDPADLPYSFTHKHVLKRICIVAAGPLFNIFLAILLFFILFTTAGIPVRDPIVGDIKEDSPAQKFGLLVGDRILRINDHPIDKWAQISEYVTSSNGSAITVDVLRGKAPLTFDITPVASKQNNIFGETIDSFTIGISPMILPIVGGISPDSPAQIAGLEKDDTIIAINGNAIQTWYDLRETVNTSQGQTLNFTIKRSENEQHIEIKPKLSQTTNTKGETEDQYLIGIFVNSGTKQVKLGIFSAAFESVNRTAYVSELVLVSIVKIIQGVVSPKNIGGPILIAQMAGDQVREGMISFLSFIAFISINLAILNFLPIPVLDGGHLLFFFLELVLRKPINMRVRELAQQVGMSLLLLLMIFVIYNDVIRIKSSIISVFHSVTSFIFG